MEPETRQALEEKIAHLERGLGELSEVVSRQDREIERLARRVEMLMGREAERESAAGGTVPLADVKPPHW
jgi:SlyX protein